MECSTVRGGTVREVSGTSSTVTVRARNYVMGRMLR